MRRAIMIVGACAALLGASASAASAADIANLATNECSGTAEWRVNLVGAYADLSVTSSTCKLAEVWVEGNGNPHVNVSDSGYTGGYRVSLLGINVTGTNSFAGIAHGYIGGGTFEVVAPNTLEATLVGTDPSKPAVSVEQHLPNGSCGTDCYKTNIRWSTTWDRTG